MKSCEEFIRSCRDGELKKILSVFTCGEVAEESDVAALFPPRPRDSHKGSYGSACVVAGSEKYLGASALSVSAALRTGCGYVYAVVPEGMKYVLAAEYPQCIFCGRPYAGADATAAGMGMTCDERTYAQICGLLKSYKGKLIIDADGLNALAAFGKQPLKDTAAQVLVTPHVGEMARLCGASVPDVKNDPAGAAAQFAREFNVTVHLKSAVSVTCFRDGEEIRNILSVRGASSLAKAGSGDMLSGLICGNAARGLSLAEAAVCSQYVLGVSAELCSESMTDYAVTAVDIIKNIPAALKRLTEGGRRC